METMGGEEKREKGRKAGKKKERWGFIEEGQETNGLGLTSRAKAQHAANPRSYSTPPGGTSHEIAPLVRACSVGSDGMSPLRIDIKNTL